MLSKKKATNTSDASTGNKQAGENENENLDVGEDNLVSKDEENYEDGEINGDDDDDA